MEICEDDIIYTSSQYRLRAGAPMSKGEQGEGDFYVHTFMAEITQVDSYMYTTSLPESTEFRGQGGNFISASFNRLVDRSGHVFSGKVMHSPEYVEETELVA